MAYYKRAGLSSSSTEAATFTDYNGNTSAASIPLALDEAMREDRIHAGDLVLMCGFGAGLTWGTALFRW